MNQKFTSEDIILFLYGEMELAEREQFLDALLQDDELFTEYEALQTAHAALIPVQVSPSKSASDRVMNVAKRSAKENRQRSTSFLATGKERILNFHHVLSIMMVVFTCLTAGAAMYAYQRLNQDANSWEMTETKGAFMDTDLDHRLEGARHRLNGILDNRSEAVVPVHESTYRVVNSVSSNDHSQDVVFLQIK